MSLKFVNFLNFKASTRKFLFYCLFLQEKLFSLNHNLNDFDDFKQTTSIIINNAIINAYVLLIVIYQTEILVLF